MDDTSDLKLLRMLCLSGTAAAPLLTLILALVSSSSKGMPECFFFMGLLLAVYLLSYRSCWVKRHPYPVLIVISSCASIDTIRLAAVNKFSYTNLLILSLLIFSVILFLKKPCHVLCFGTANLLCLTAAMLTNRHTVGEKTFIFAIYTFFFAVAFAHSFMISRIEKSQLESEEHYRNLVENSPEAIVISQNGVIVYVNSTAVRMAAGTRTEDLVGRPISEFLEDDCLEMVEDRIRKVTEGVKVDFREMRLLRLDNKMQDIEGNLIRGSFNGKPAMISILKDITERKEAEEQIRHMAYYDMLTGLPNRRMLNDFLSASLHTQTPHRQIGILFLDVDNFKTINDTLGHKFGDALLQRVSQRIRDFVYPQDTVYRYGGDEFVVVLPDTDIYGSSLSAQRIIEGLNGYFNIGHKQIFVTVSIGISIYPEDGRDADTLIKNADIAMYLAKSSGKNNYQYFTQSLNDAVTREMELQNGLREALRRNEFTLYYQPQVELKTGKIVGMEALLRWNYGDMGMISPNEFIPIAEENGMIHPIGEWVLRTACRQCKTWQTEGLDPFVISVNFSGVQFQKANMVETIKEILQETGLDPRWLQIEITESVIQKVEETNSIITQLKSLGIRIAIDDFGTGYSSLNLLKFLSIDSLKLDPTFTEDISVNRNAEYLLKSIIGLAHDLSINTVAEGIEYQQQLSQLRKFDCDTMQGYLFSRPEPAKMIEGLLMEHQHSGGPSLYSVN